MGGLKGPVSTNGNIENFRQGNVQDCGFLATIKALSLTEKGSKIIKESIFSDETGTSHGVNFANGDTAAVFDEDIESARQYSGHGEGQRVYSQFDDDVTLLEMAAEKVFETSQDPILREIVDNYPTRFIEGIKDDMLYGVDPASVTYLYTGKKCETIIKHSDKVAATFIPTSSYSALDVNGNERTLNAGEKYKIGQNGKNFNFNNNTQTSQYTFDASTLKNFFETDAQESYNKAVELFSEKDDDDMLVFATTGQEIFKDINGNKIDSLGSHAYAVEGVEDDIVTLIDPRDTSSEIQVNLDEIMNIESFYLYSLDLSE